MSLYLKHRFTLMKVSIRGTDRIEFINNKNQIYFINKQDYDNWDSD